MTDSSLGNRTSKVITLEEVGHNTNLGEHIHSIPLAQHGIYLIFYFVNFLILYTYENTCQSWKHKKYIKQAHCVSIINQAYINKKKNTFLILTTSFRSSKHKSLQQHTLQLETSDNPPQLSQGE